MSQFDRAAQHYFDTPDPKERECGECGHSESEHEPYHGSCTVVWPVSGGAQCICEAFSDTYDDMEYEPLEVGE